MLESAHGKLYSVNRLDRLTSGLCIFAKTKSKASMLMDEMRSRLIHKTYIAKCRGKFPDFATCSEPLAPHPEKPTLMVVCATGKQSSTVFERLAHDGEFSLVKVHPLTGRTHQIRVHMAFLGFPIANDPHYGGYPRVSYTRSVSEGCDGCIQPFPDPPEHELIWLHSLEYSGELWNYKTKLPEWAIA